MITFNFTGLSRVYWLPSIVHESDHADLWFTAIRWLGVEVIFYSIAMATEFINRINRENLT